MHEFQPESDQREAKAHHRHRKSLWEQNYAEGVYQELDDGKGAVTTAPVEESPRSGPWKSAETPSFKTKQIKHRHDPDEMGRIMERSRQLPQPCYLSNNIILVNQERSKRIIAPLTRCSELDEIARQHALKMAVAGHRSHSDLNHAVLQSHDLCCLMVVGENVAKGTDIRDMHKTMMQTTSDRNNILDRRYAKMGMGTARGPNDGLLYLCQIFCG